MKCENCGRRVDGEYCECCGSWKEEQWHKMRKIINEMEEEDE